MRHNRVIIAGLVLLGSFAVAGAARATPLTNGDFSAGFTGWQGEVTDIFFNTTLIDPLSGAFPDNFDASSGAAVLTTTTLANDIFSVFIFQEFELPTLGPGQALRLSYDLSASLTDPVAGDTAFAQLNHGPNLTSTINLLGMSSVDVSFLAGQTVELQFGVEDFDGGITNFVDPEDTLVVDNIAVTAIPLPATLPLLVPGLLGLILANRWSRAPNVASVTPS